MTEFLSLQGLSGPDHRGLGTVCARFGNGAVVAAFEVRFRADLFLLRTLKAERKRTHGSSVGGCRALVARHRRGEFALDVEVHEALDREFVGSAPREGGGEEHSLVACWLCGSELVSVAAAFADHGQARSKCICRLCGARVVSCTV